jgi:ketosteroid isomerase-like protein
MGPAELHSQVQTAFNAADVDALVALYEPDARMFRDDGTVAEGVDAIREVWAGLIALGGSLAMTTRHAVEADEIALLSNSWTFTMDGAEVASSITSEVARRQPDGTWRYVIDNPYGAP